MHSIFIKKIIYFSFAELNFELSYYTFYLFNIGRSNFRPAYKIVGGYYTSTKVCALRLSATDSAET